MQVEDVLRCSECAAPIKPNQERCEYCGYWLIQPKPVIDIPESVTEDYISYSSSSITTTAIEVIITFVLAMIVIFVGINLFNPVANAIDKSGAIQSVNTLLGQLTWIFVAMIFVGVITFLGILGKYVGEERY